MACNKEGLVMKFRAYDEPSDFARSLDADASARAAYDA